LSHKHQLPTHPSASHEEGGEGNWLVSYADMMTLLVGFFVILLSFSTVDNEKLEGMRKAITLEFGGNYQVPYGDMSERIREAIKKLGLGDQFIIKQTDLGIEISFMGTVFFDTGSANIKSGAQDLLKTLIPVIKKENGEFDITVEGHTDDVPIGSGLPFRNNWELSSVRACRVLEKFADAGFSKAHLTAVGFGDAKPIVPNRDSAGKPIPLNQSQNRRVVIKLLKRSESVMPQPKQSAES
jgi:chemotaxis protein MotB